MNPTVGTLSAGSPSTVPTETDRGSPPPHTGGRATVTGRVAAILESHPTEWFTPYQLHTEYVDRWGPVLYETIRRVVYRLDTSVRRTPYPGRGHDYTIAIRYKEDAP